MDFELDSKMIDCLFKTPASDPSEREDTKKNIGKLYDKKTARELYDNGLMPEFAYIQLYATPEEAWAIKEIKMKKLTDDYFQRKREETQQKEIERTVHKTLNDFFNSLK